MDSDQQIERSDQQLVTAILAGDHDAFTALYERFSRRIYHYALKRLRDPVEAEDVAQDVFMEVYLSLRSFQGRSSLSTWMFGIAHHQVGRRTRKRVRETLTFSDEQVLQVPAAIVPADHQLDVVRTLARCQQVVERELTRSQRRVFRLRFVRNQSMRSIATQLGTTANAVKLNLSRSRRTLNRHMAEYAAVV
jgi:RNA polymerase sigma-70 factor (ECF subfamily)